MFTPYLIIPPDKKPEVLQLLVKQTPNKSISLNKAKEEIDKHPYIDICQGVAIETDFTDNKVNLYQYYIHHDFSLKELEKKINKLGGKVVWE